jgi:hypothetical protein
VFKRGILCHSSNNLSYANVCQYYYILGLYWRVSTFKMCFHKFVCATFYAWKTVVALATIIYIKPCDRSVRAYGPWSTSSMGLACWASYVEVGQFCLWTNVLHWSMIMALALGQQSRVATVMRYLNIESPGGCWVMTVDNLAGDCYRSSWARERSKYNWGYSLRFCDLLAFCVHGWRRESWQARMW